MQPIIVWYLWIVILGMIGIPITHKLFVSLPSKGYAFSKIISIFLWGVIFWLLSSYGILLNNLGGHLFALFLVAGLSYWAGSKIGWGKLIDWIKENKPLITRTELVFLVFFVFLVILRGFAPGLDGTEKPMEIAFINAIISSPTMPPHDPWLADYSISYYYLGFLFTALLIQITKVTTGIGFNLMISTIFALAAIGSYGILFDLLVTWKSELRKQFYTLAIFAPVFILLVSNGEGFLEILHSQGVFWQQNENQQYTSVFWQETIGIKDLENPPAILFNEEDQEPRFWWWWRASRVVRDFTYPIVQDISREDTPDGFVWSGGDAVQDVEVIDEFPFFAFHLADLHPHVLTIPFALMAIAFFLQIFLTSTFEENYFIYQPLLLNWQSLLFASLLIGGLAFLNIWDILSYFSLLAIVLFYRRLISTSDVKQSIISLGITLGLIVIGIVLIYFPFFYGFASQAGGILPNLINPTRTPQLWLMWGTLITPIISFLLYINVKHHLTKRILKSAGIALTIILGLWGISSAMAYMIVEVVPSISPNNPLLQNLGQQFLSIYFFNGKSLPELMQEGFSRRINAWGSMLTIAILFSFSLHLLPKFGSSSTHDKTTSKSSQFIFILIILGTFLIVGPEFLYLRDQFGTRMNTVFKFYSQAWILWGISAGYASAILLSSSNKLKKFFLPILFLTLVVGLSYPFLAVQTSMPNYRRAETEKINFWESWELDGTANTPYKHYGHLSNPDEIAAVEWLRSAPQGTLVEAVGGSYSAGARIATHSGQPGLLGWPFHESQWRGGTVEMGSRESDIATIYSSGSWVETEVLLNKYHVKYLFVSYLENNSYPNLQIAKFFKNLGEPVFSQGETYIFMVP